jgi:hypothetical protein
MERSATVTWCWIAATDIGWRSTDQLVRLWYLLYFLVYGSGACLLGATSLSCVSGRHTGCRYTVVGKLIAYRLYEIVPRARSRRLWQSSFRDGGFDDKRVGKAEPIAGQTAEHIHQAK